MNNTSLIIQSTRVVHKDFIHLIETMRSNFDNIYYLKNDDSHLDIVFKNNKNIKSIVIKRNNMSDRFDKFLCLWKEISYLSLMIFDASGGTSKLLFLSASQLSTIAVPMI